MSVIDSTADVRVEEQAHAKPQQRMLLSNEHVMKVPLLSPPRTMLRTAPL
jgi:hypothetical protein